MGDGLSPQILDFRPPLPHLVITGGDPLKRPDLFAVVSEATHLGLRVSLAPSATEALTGEAIARLQRAGVVGMSLSLDGSAAGPPLFSSPTLWIGH